MGAIAILRELDAGRRERVKPQDPHGFVPAAWRPFLAKNGKFDRRIWKISLAFAIRDAFRAGNLFLAESRSFWNLVYDDRRWQETRGEAYGRLDLSAEPHAFLDKLLATLDRATARGLPGNRFATVRDGKLKLKQRCRSRRRCGSCARPSKQACRAYGSKTCCRMPTSGAVLPAPFNRSAATNPAKETRIAASLRDRLTPAHVVMQRVINASPADRVAKALTALGRLAKTIHILRYVHEEPLRRAIQLQLNRGEFRHALAKWLFFANQGAFRTGDYEEIMNKASCLSLMSNAVLVWNTVHIECIGTQLRAAGNTVLDEDIARVSPPVPKAHHGSYFQSPRSQATVAPATALV